MQIAKSTDKISAMFDEISGKYDKLNHLFTFNIDKKWRRAIVKQIIKVGLKKDRILDAASGTGDQTLELLKLNPVEVVSCDISEGMLNVQRGKINDDRVKIINKDVMELDADEKFDIITVSFGFRNFSDQELAMKKFYDLLNPGGIAVVLEMFRSDNYSARMFNLYFRKVIPKLGNAISGSDYAYNYLFDSVDGYYTVDEFKTLAVQSGFEIYKSINNFLMIVNSVYIMKK